jgi:hypothetical protein
LALNRGEAFVAGHVETRHGVEQCLEVGMLGAPKDIVERAGLHDLPLVHDHHLFGDIGHHAQVVGYHQHRHAELLLQIGEQFEDLGLDRHVERRGRLVGDQQGRAADQSHGDHGPLTQSPR